MLPALLTAVFAVVVAALVSTIVVLGLDPRFRAGVVVWWYGDREAWWERCTAIIAVVITALVSTIVVVGLDSRCRASVVDWWYDDREAWWERKSRSSMTGSVATCAVCGDSSTLRCGRCKAVKYCSKECQLKHWADCHKRLCVSPTASVEPSSLDFATASTTGRVASTNNCSSVPEKAPSPKLILHPYAHFKSFFGDKSVFQRKSPVGLRNLGNTCFANSVLQCLLHTRSLASFFRSRIHTKGCIKPSKHSFCLLCELEKLVCEYLDASAQDTVAPKQLLSRLPKIAKHMVLGRQEDAHEFYVHLVDVMEAIMLEEKGGKEKYDQRTRETTFVHHLFGGYVRNWIVCDACGQESRTFESTMQLELAISAGTDSIEAALKRHFSDEVLDGDNKYHCEKCKAKVRAIRGQRLEVAPNVLVICLKRFDSGSYFYKNNKPVRYKEMLDVSPYLAEDALDSPETCIYRLHGVVMHLDIRNSTGSGHYLSYVNADGQQWYLCNDIRVQQTTREKALDPRAYMLFYTRQVPHTGPTAKGSTPDGQHKTCNGHMTSKDGVLEATPGPQSHPIPASESRDLSPPACRTPSPTRPRMASTSLRSVSQDVAGESSVASERQAEPNSTNVCSRPIPEVVSSTSESTDDEANMGHLPYCIRGRLGQAGVVKVILDLGKAECRAKDVQVAMSGDNHVIVHIPGRQHLDFDMGEGVAIEKLGSRLVKKRNHLKMLVTLAAAETNTTRSQSCSPPQTPTASQRHKREPSDSPLVLSCTFNGPDNNITSRQPHADSPTSCVTSGIANDNEACGASDENVTSGLKDHGSFQRDCWSWPPSVGSDCESIDLNRGQQPSCPETGTSTSTSQSMLGAHPLSSAPASESPCDSDPPPPLEDLADSAADTPTVAGKKRRKKHRPPATPATGATGEQKEMTLDPLINTDMFVGDASTSTRPIRSLAIQEDEDGGLTPAPAPRTLRQANGYQAVQPEVPQASMVLTPAGRQAASSSGPSVAESDGSSVGSDSDLSQEKNNDGSVDVTGEGDPVKHDATQGDEKDAPKQKTQKGKGKKGGKSKNKKKKARKH